MNDKLPAGEHPAGGGPDNSSAPNYTVEQPEWKAEKPSSPYRGNGAIPLRDAALFYHKLGFNVLPIGENKKPVNPATGKELRWSQWQTKRQPRKVVEDWEWEKATGIAAIHGEVSGGLVALDFDLTSEDKLNQFLQAAGIPPTYSWIVKTGKGWHVWLKAQTLSGLASKAAGNTGEPAVEWGGELRTPQVELRAYEHYTVLPPSLHPSGHIYHYTNNPGLPDEPLLTFDPGHILSSYQSLLVDGGDGAGENVQAEQGAYSGRDAWKNRIDPNTPYGQYVSDVLAVLEKRVGLDKVHVAKNGRSGNFFCIYHPDSEKGKPNASFDYAALHYRCWHSGCDVSAGIDKLATKLGFRPWIEIERREAVAVNELYDPHLFPHPSEVFDSSVSNELIIPDYVVGQWLMLPQAYIIFGQPKTGKSMVAQELCYCLADGSAWLGETVHRPMSSFYLNLEMHETIWRMREYAMLKHHPLLREGRAEHKVYHSSMPREHFMGNSVEQAIRLMNTAEKLGVQHVLIDSLHRSARGLDENSPEIAEVTHVLQDEAIRRGIILGFVHHSRKGGSGNLDDLRGTSALGADVGAVLAVIARTTSNKGKEMTIGTAASRMGDMAKKNVTLDLETDGRGSILSIGFRVSNVQTIDTPARLRELFLARLSGKLTDKERQAGALDAYVHYMANAKGIPATKVEVAMVRGDLVADGTIKVRVGARQAKMHYIAEVKQSENGEHYIDFDV